MECPSLRDPNLLIKKMLLTSHLFDDEDILVVADYYIIFAVNFCIIFALLSTTEAF